MDPDKTLNSISKEECEKLDRKKRSTIHICHSYIVLSNILEEDTTKKLWDKLENLYKLKSLVNKLFIWKKLYLLRMNKEK